ncbi:haloalkane dehalogenase [Parasedimentitalea marina]|uniref:Haloalkane dehalogenase n=1 Tax=Parasedimentitalea marina TaxID=2483033 RepID=A0A3T0N3X6_9RHOB|nr:haloalkane dehalogenase [Parasedimentitalea marina]AZV78694.1 haloalkane dehalogenase [Parasedimentitalea marina]
MNRRSALKSGIAAAALTVLNVPAFAQTTMALEKSYTTVLGQKMAYYDVGEGRPVVFLHGNPASAYLWRNIIPHVAGSHRAIAPDLIGMGDSDKPVLENTYTDSAEYLFAFLDALELKDAVLVIHDWGSGLGWEYARTRPGRISAIAFMEAMTPPFIPYESYESLGPFADFVRNVKTPGVGEEMIMNQNILLDQFMRHGGARGSLSDDVMAEYNRYFPTPESRKILLDWAREIPVAGEPADVYEVASANNKWLLQSELPKLLLHVDPGAIIPMAQAKYLQQTLKNLETVFLGSGGHFVQEDYPDEIGKALTEWLTRV